MAELERRLADLARHLEWPETPELELRLEPARPARRRRALVVALAALALAVAVAFAVPPARSAILRFLHLGGVTVERVETLPDAVERPLAAGLGREVDEAEAEAVLGRPFALPDGVEARLHADGPVVSALLPGPEPVLLSQLRSAAGAGLAKAIAAGATSVEQVLLEPGVEAAWIEGAPHTVEWPSLPPRLARNVLVWERDGITYRLEGRTLTRERALELAAELR